MQKLLVVKTGNDTFAVQAQMAELVDALDSKSGYRKVVQVRFLFWAQKSSTSVGDFLYEKKELDVSSSTIQQFLTLFTKPYRLL